MTSFGVTLLSGGLDSTTVTQYAKDRVDHMMALTFYYGQTHSKEVECAQQIAEMMGIQHKLLDISFLSEVAWYSALTNPEQLRTLITERRNYLAEGGTLAELEGARTKVSEIELEKGRTANLYTKGYIGDQELDVRLKGVTERLEYAQEEVRRLEGESANATRTLEALEDYSEVAIGLKDRLETNKHP